VVDAVTATVDRAPPATRGAPTAASPARAPGPATVVGAVATLRAAAPVMVVDARTGATGDGRRAAVADAPRGAAPTGGREARAPTVAAAATARTVTVARAIVGTEHVVTGVGRPGRAAPGTSGRRVRGTVTVVGTTAIPPTAVGTGQVLATTAEAASVAGTPRVRGRGGSGTASTVARSHATPRDRRSLTRCRSLSSTAPLGAACGR
jgi:hypothetical protein